jgi:hypothetical protein
MKVYSYRHRQVGLLFGIVAVTVLIGGLILVRTLSLHGEQYSWLMVGLPVVITVATLALFSVLEISIDERALTWRFLPVFITKSVSLADILEAKPTRTSFIYGWGIHYTDRGWLYNVSGLDAVHVRMRDGKQFMLGTDEPAELANAINRGKKTAVKTF